MNDAQRNAVVGRFEEAKLVARDFFKFVKNKLPHRLSARIDREDVEGEALLAVSRCYADARMDARSFLRTVVYNRLRKWLKAELTHFDEEFNLSAFLSDADLEEPAFLEDERPFANPADRAAMNELHSAVADLPEPQQRAVGGITRGETVRQLAGDLGVSKSMAHKHRQAGLNTLRAYYGVA